MPFSARSVRRWKPSARFVLFAGSRALTEAYKQAHSNSPLLSDSGSRFKDERSKSLGATTYKAAFDAKARQMGIVNPEQHRAD
jgi:hypothetical protein